MSGSWSIIQSRGCQRLCECGVSDEGCAALTSALRSNPSYLRYLDLSCNNLGDSGVKSLSAVLGNPHCKLETLELRKCGVSDEGCAALTSGLRSNPSHLRYLDLSKNNLGDSGVKSLSAVLENPHCKLETLGVGSAAFLQNPAGAGPSLDATELAQSLCDSGGSMYIEKSRGPKTEPCGTPYSTGITLDISPFKSTKWYRSDRRMVFMVFKEGVGELNVVFKFTVEGFDYNIFVSSDTDIKCFKCGQTGHLARACPERQSDLGVCERPRQDAAEPAGVVPPAAAVRPAAEGPGAAAAPDLMESEPQAQPAAQRPTGVKPAPEKPRTAVPAAAKPRLARPDWKKPWVLEQCWSRLR
ncbi:hypothetical protein QTP70_001030 [Hemibagrus guttatus]|uniref:CCHC-type domain-containing protein n=1 Tax=Hemibagrus guttatus TaxID=175788 RepID=A0AAE0QAS7_9TELE|nr:hypothetical protein QTP70_001030 [Hemibagrus guttatus]